MSQNEASLRDFNNKGIKKYIYEKALSLWGIHAQIMKAVEESSEFIQSSMKLLFSNKQHSRNFYEPELKNFIEEYADLEIMMEQIEEWYGKNFRNHVNKVKNQKLEKLDKKLKEMENGRVKDSV